MARTRKDSGPAAAGKSAAAPPPAKSAPARPAAAKPATAQGANVKRSASQKRELLGTLCDQVRGCRLCPELVKNRTQTVFGVGNVQTRLVFLGEAPGADEDKRGEPFVGRAGQLLDKIIEACSLRREDIYILNTVKCRPPDNRTPLPEEMDNCRSFLDQQLEIIRPEFLCCLGRTAAMALFGPKAALAQLRGKVHSWNGLRVVVTYHPAYLLRNPAAKKDAWEDMQLLMRDMGMDVPGKKTRGK